MQAITIEIPLEIASQLRLPPKRAKRMLMEELVIRLYEQEIITAGQAPNCLKWRDFVSNDFWQRMKFRFTVRPMN